MKITDVELIVLDTGKDYPDPNQALEAHGVRFVALLKVSTDEGITGWSDIETQPHTAAMIVNAPSGGQIGFESVRNALIGEDPLEREWLWQKMYRYLAYYGRSGSGMHVISGVDNALWDIAGKAFNQPVCKLLGARYRTSVKAYASTLFRPSPDDMRRAVANYLGHGFQAIKFGWGVFGHDLKLDIALISAAREEAGPHIDLMVDGGWYGTDYHRPFKARSLHDWIKLIDVLEDLGIFWLEDCLHPENLQGYAQLSQATTHVRIAAGEQASGIYEFERLALEGNVHTLQPDLSRCGGLTVGKQIADFAMRRQFECVPHAWLTDLLKASSLHLNAYLMNALYLEYNVSSSSLLNQLCLEPLTMTEGYLAVPTGPGLGVNVNEELIARYRVH